MYKRQVLDPATLPKDCTAVLGQTKSARITTMINSILAHSDGDVAVGAEENEAFLALRDFMYATVYVDKTAKAEAVSYTHLDVYKRQA